MMFGTKIMRCCAHALGNVASECLVNTSFTRFYSNVVATSVRKQNPLLRRNPDESQLQHRARLCQLYFSLSVKAQESFFSRPARAYARKETILNSAKEHPVQSKFGTSLMTSSEDSKGKTHEIFPRIPLVKKGSNTGKKMHKQVRQIQGHRHKDNWSKLLWKDEIVARREQRKLELFILPREELLGRNIEEALARRKSLKEHAIRYVASKESVQQQNSREAPSFDISEEYSLHTHDENSGKYYTAPLATTANEHQSSSRKFTPYLVFLMQELHASISDGSHSGSSIKDLNATLERIRDMWLRMDSISRKYFETRDSVQGNTTDDETLFQAVQVFMKYYRKDCVTTDLSLTSNKCRKGEYAANAECTPHSSLDRAEWEAMSEQRRQYWIERCTTHSMHRTFVSDLNDLSTEDTSTQSSSKSELDVDYESLLKATKRLMDLKTEDSYS